MYSIHCTALHCIWCDSHPNVSSHLQFQSGQRKYSWNFSLIQLSCCFWFTVLLHSAFQRRMYHVKECFFPLFLAHAQPFASWSLTKTSEKLQLNIYLWSSWVWDWANNLDRRTCFVVFTSLKSVNCTAHRAASLIKLNKFNSSNLKWRMFSDSFI